MLENPPLDDAVVRQIEGDLHVADALALSFGPAGPVGGEVAEHAVQPFDVNRIEDILRRLQPMASRYGVADLAPRVLLDEQIPARQQRRRSVAEIAEDEPAELLDLVRG